MTHSIGGSAWNGLPDGATADRRLAILLTAATILSIAGYVVTVAMGRPAGIALFLATWLVPLALRPERMVDALRYWPLWLVPAVALASVAWSRDRTITLRNAAELIVFTATAITMVRVAGRRRVILGIVIAFGAIALFSLLSGAGNRALGGGINLTGAFASKNALALFCGVLALSGLAGMLDRGASLPHRAICAGGAALGVVVGLAARSLGANVATLAACATLVGALVVGRLPVGPRRLVVGALALVAAIVAAAGALLPSDVLGPFLVSIGKSPDISGRTYLWSQARVLIGDHPLIGFGYQAFWLPQFEDARGLYRFGQIANEKGFHFHNLIYETWVELGAIGLAAMGAMMAAVVFAALRRFDRRPDAAAAFGLATIVFFFVRATVEVDFLVAFNLGNLMFALVYVTSFARDAAPAPARRVALPRYRGELPA